MPNCTCVKREVDISVSSKVMCDLLVPVIQALILEFFLQYQYTYTIYMISFQTRSIVPVIGFRCERPKKKNFIFSSQLFSDCIDLAPSHQLTDTPFHTFTGKLLS